jgi:20S proteasome subunit beta 7
MIPSPVLYSTFSSTLAVMHNFQKCQQTVTTIVGRLLIWQTLFELIFMDPSFPIQEDPSVITGASSLIAVKYDNGVLLSADKMVTYGSSLFYGDFSHFSQISPNILLGCSGELSDFQELVKLLQRQVTAEECRTGGTGPTPAEVQNYIKRYLYQRRSKMNPLAVKCVLAGINRDGSSFLGVTDLYGTSWEDDIICTGIAAHLKGLQLDNAVGQDRDSVLRAVNEVWKGIYARSLVQNGPLEFYDVSATGIRQLAEVDVKVDWSCIEALWGREAIA